MPNVMSSAEPFRNHFCIVVHQPFCLIINRLFSLFGYVYSQGSYRTYRTAPPYTEDATMRSKTSKRGGIVVETSRAPHPLCPNTRSCCCLLLLFNLGLLLICLGFVIVLQLNDPPFVW